MTDIVAQLRSFAEDEDETVVAQAFYREAADEIERLRKALREVLEDYEAYGGPSWREPQHDPDILKRAKEALRHD